MSYQLSDYHQRIERARGIWRGWRFISFSHDSELPVPMDLAVPPLTLNAETGRVVVVYGSLMPANSPASGSSPLSVSSRRGDADRCYDTSPAMV